MQQVMKISNSPIFSTAIPLHQNYQMGSLPPELHHKSEKKNQHEVDYQNQQTQESKRYPKKEA
jgi:hypothetical protein